MQNDNVNHPSHYTDGKISVGRLYVDIIGVEATDGDIISLGLIDAILKEYEVEE